MKSRTTRQFRELLAQLPAKVRQQARAAYKLFKRDPSHPGLHFKKVINDPPTYSGRVGIGYRAVGVLADDTIIWFWIGSHPDYDKAAENDVVPPVYSTWSAQMSTEHINRRGFVEQSITAGAGLALASIAGSAAAAQQQKEQVKSGDAKRIKVAVIGCGSVSNSYLPNLAKCPYVELVSTCDIIPERAAKQAKRFNIAHHFPHIEKQLAGPAFDLLVNLTDMQEHEHLNREAIAAGKHVWSEKPIANTLAAGQKLLEHARSRGVRLWGAPIVVHSPHFAYMAKALAAGKLGHVAAAHADYGHGGPTWSSFFYEKGGGSLPDLGVYNLTTLTGLLGPAKAVIAMVGIVTPTRTIDRKGKIQVTEEDNAMVVMDHGNGVFSHVQSGFNYFNPHGHEGSKETRHTISIVGTRGVMGLVGYDWEPMGVDLATQDHPTYERAVTEKTDYVWQQGASLAAETLATGKEWLFTPEHALHVVEVIVAARESQRTGRRIELTSTFKWPVV